MGLKFGWFIKDFYQNLNKYECAYKYSKKLKNIKLSHRTKDFKIDLKKIVPNFKNAETFFRAKSIENNCLVETAKNIDEINDKILNFIKANNYSSDLFVWPSIKN